MTGPRRGNPAVRFMIEQTARRRLWPGPDAAAADVAAQGDAVRWSRGFFERVRGRMLPRMAAVTELAEGQLRYYGSEALSLWALVAPNATALALDHGESASEIRERAGRWLRCLATRTAPGLASSHWGHPVYGARVDLPTGELDVVWAFAGSWCDAVLSDSLPERTRDAPRAWLAEAAPAQG